MIFNLLLKLKCYELLHFNFRQFARLEDKKKLIIQATEDNSFDFQKCFEDYLSVAFNFRFDVSKVFWKDTIRVFLRIASKVYPKTRIPLLEPSDEPKGKDQPWDYSERGWYMYANIIAKTYGWDYDKIAKMRTDDALALIQEILTDDQIEKEFHHSLSEVAYEYNKQTKKSHRVPLSRPAWMRPKFTTVEKKQKIPVNLLPIGNTINLTDEIEKKHLQATKLESDMEGLPSA